MGSDILREISDIEERLWRIKRAVRGRLGPSPDSLVDLFGTWKGEIDTFLQELYRRRERKGRELHEELPL